MGITKEENSKSEGGQAASKYFEYGKLADEESVLEEVQKIGLNREWSEYLVFRRRIEEGDGKALEEVRKLVQLQEKEYKSGNIQAEEMAEWYFEQADCCEIIGRPYAKELEERIYMKKCVDTYPSGKNYMRQGNMLLRAGQEELAMKDLREAEKQCEENDTWLISRVSENIGWILEKRGNYEEALMYYCRSLEAEPQQYMMPMRIINMSACLMKKYGSVAYANMALHYINLYLEYAKDRDMALLSRCDILLTMKRFEEALADANEVLEIRVLDVFGSYYQGCAYMGLGRFTEALSSFKDAADTMDGGRLFLGVYEKAGKCCEYLKQYEQAEMWYRKGRDVNTNEEHFFRLLRDLYLKTGQLSKAEAAMYHVNYEIVYLREIAKARLRLQHADNETERQRILEEIKENANKAPENIKHSFFYERMTVWTLLADTYLYDLKDYKAAKTCYEEALKEAQDAWNTKGIMLSLMYLYHQTNDMGKVHKYGEQFRNLINERYSFNQSSTPIEQYTNSLVNRKKCLAQMALYSFLMDDLDKAREYQQVLEAYTDYLEGTDSVKEYDSYIIMSEREYK